MPDSDEDDKPYDNNLYFCEKCQSPVNLLTPYRMPPRKLAKAVHEQFEHWGSWERERFVKELLRLQPNILK